MMWHMGVMLHLQTFWSNEICRPPDYLAIGVLWLGLVVLDGSRSSRDNRQRADAVTAELLAHIVRFFRTPPYTIVQGPSLYSDIRRYATVRRMETGGKYTFHKFRLYRENVSPMVDWESEVWLKCDPALLKGLMVTLTPRTLDAGRIEFIEQDRGGSWTELEYTGGVAGAFRAAGLDI